MSTIIAIATPAQNGPIGIIRLSGPKSLKIVLPFLKNKGNERFSELKPRMATFAKLLDAKGDLLDQCLALYMPGPQSFTGEDVIELHCHGNLPLLRRILRVLLESSEDLRAAEAGEFSKRAFLNGKMDLTQAEAVHQLISSSHERASRLSLANLDGLLARLIAGMRASLVALLAQVEASFEFAEEDIETFSRVDIFACLKEIESQLLSLKTSFQTSKLIDHGVTAAIIGPPNVGKSSLLNALLLEDRAIVSDIPGTTRDVVESSKVLGGIRFIFKDTAGLRKTVDPVESFGIERTRRASSGADLVLLLTDSLDDFGISYRPEASQIVLRVLNKLDLFTHSNESLADAATRLNHNHQFDTLLSVKNAFGLDRLENLLIKAFETHNNVQNIAHINERQFYKISKCVEIISNLKKHDVEHFAVEELAEEIRSLISTLGEITGEITNEHILEEIFSRFCIGK